MQLPKNDGYSFEEKWSPEIAIYNFTQVPNLLLACQGHLGLKDGELITLIHLFTYWFGHDSRIYPSIETLCRFSQNGYSTVQRRLRILEQKEFLKRRHQFGTSNTYDIIPCVIKLHKHQKVCPNPPRKQGEYRIRNDRSVPSILINKEYEAKRVSLNNNKKPRKFYIDRNTTR